MTLCVESTQTEPEHQHDLCRGDKKYPVSALINMEARIYICPVLWETISNIMSPNPVWMCACQFADTPCHFHSCTCVDKLMPLFVYCTCIVKTSMQCVCVCFWMSIGNSTTHLNMSVTFGFLRVCLIVKSTGDAVLIKIDEECPMSWLG